MDDQDNPYTSPEIPVTIVSNDATMVDYWRPISFAFDSPDWIKNTFFVAIVQFIPIVGPMVLMGYQYEIVIALLRNPGSSCPNFDFNRFSDYLMRGVWPLLVSLVWGLGIGIVIWGVVMLGMLATAAVVQGVAEVTAVTIVACVGTVAFFAIMAASIGLQLLVLPLALKAGLQKDFSAGMSLSFSFQFLGNTWQEMIKFGLLMTVVALAAVFVGLLIFCIGQYFTIGIMFVAQAHIMAQLYRLHCLRGGEPIPITD